MDRHFKDKKPSPWLTHSKLIEMFFFFLQTVFFNIAHVNQTLQQVVGGFNSSSFGGCASVKNPAQKDCLTLPPLVLKELQTHNKNSLMSFGAVLASLWFPASCDVGFLSLRELSLRPQFIKTTQLQHNDEVDCWPLTILVGSSLCESVNVFSRLASSAQIYLWLSASPQ